MINLNSIKFNLPKEEKKARRHRDAVRASNKPKLKIASQQAPSSKIRKGKIHEKPKLSLKSVSPNNKDDDREPP